MQPLYLHGACTISPQPSFDTAAFPGSLQSSDNNRLQVVDAPYAAYISPVAIRRMSRLLKMSITAGMKALENAGIESPGAIITGTSRGSMTDTEQFLNDMIRLEEQALNPTCFIQSTYNSPNGWLAMQTKCTGYNQTYVHRGHSLELALLDAQMLLSEHSGPFHALVGSYDEMTEEYYTVMNKIGYWKKEPVPSNTLLQRCDTPGSIGGEGVSFFVVSNSAGGALARIDRLQLLEHPSAEELSEAVRLALAEAGGAPGCVLAGLNGDSRALALYEAALRLLPESVPVAGFKHLCGEYDTSTGFALWLGALVLQRQQLPEGLQLNTATAAVFSSILLINHSLENNWTVTLLRQP